MKNTSLVIHILKNIICNFQNFNNKKKFYKIKINHEYRKSIKLEIS
jgi:hypothetical protein